MISESFIKKFLSIPNVLYFFWVFGPLALDLLNIFWFNKMFKGMLKALKVKNLNLLASQSLEIGFNRRASFKNNRRATPKTRSSQGLHEKSLRQSEVNSDAQEAASEAKRMRKYCFLFSLVHSSF